MNPATTNLPTEFLDSQGRAWNLAITIGSARRVKEATAVDLGKVSDGKLFIELGLDPFKFAAVLYSLCEKQAETRNVEPEEFAESLNGDAIDSAMQALIEAIVLFCRAPVRGAMRTVIQTAMKAQQTSMDAVEAWAIANTPRVTETIRQQTTAALATFGK